jgi:hypothetical protein
LLWESLKLEVPKRVRKRRIGKAALRDHVIRSKLASRLVGTFSNPPLYPDHLVMERDMAALNSDLVRAGLALKISQIKLATRSYIRDRSEQATGTIAGYLVGAAFFVAAGVFVIAACFVGALALFRWLEMRYGLFPAYGVIGGLFALVAGVCAVIAASALRRPKREFPSLGSRLRVAVKANPLRPPQTAGATRDAASAVVLRPSASARQSRSHIPSGDNRLVGAGLILAATVVGWAAARRRQQARHAFRPEVNRGPR